MSSDSFSRRAVQFRITLFLVVKKKICSTILNREKNLSLKIIIIKHLFTN